MNEQNEKKPKMKKKIRKLTRRMQARFLLVFCVILAVLLALVIRLIYIENIERYEKNALAQQCYVTSVIPYQRGNILDRNGQVLATSELVYHLILDPKVLLTNEDNVKPTVTALVSVYGLDESELLLILDEQATSSYVVLKKKLSYDEKEQFNQYVESLGEKSSTIKGVWFEEEYRRTYPFSNIASHVIGFTVSGDVGTYGIEQYYNDMLIGTNGRTYGYYDSQLNIQRTTKDAQNGNTIVSTIDINVQSVVQKNVESFLNEVGAENVGVIMMNADNGEVLAMQSNYSFNLNDPRSLTAWYTEEQLQEMTSEAKLTQLYKIWRNFCISDAYEPGSTFKPFTVSAALEENIVSVDDEFICDGREEFPGNVTIKCSNQWGHGKISLAQSLMYSCNDALMQIAALEGKSIFHSYQTHFLMGEKTGIDLPGETKGGLFTEEQLGTTELATSSFGQGFTVNMIQMAAAFSSLINGGVYYEPHIVKSIKNDEGATVQEIKPVEVTKTVSSQTSEFIREAMYLTVQDGTAKKAQVTGYVIGGKTGTAQKLPRADKKNLVSFLGFVQNEDSRIVIYVVVDEAHDDELMKKSSTASSMAASILEEALPYLKIYPEGEIKYFLNVVEETDIQTDQENNSTYLPENDEDTTDVISQ